MFVDDALFHQCGPKQIKIRVFEITSNARIWFQMDGVVGNPVGGCQAQTTESGHMLVTS